MANKFEPVQKVLDVQLNNLTDATKGVDDLAGKFERLSAAAKGVKVSMDNTVLRALAEQTKLALQNEQARQKILQAQAKTQGDIYNAQTKSNNADAAALKIDEQREKISVQALKAETQREELMRKQVQSNNEILRQKMLQQRYDITAAREAERQQKAQAKAADDAAKQARNSRIGGIANVFADKTGAAVASYAAQFIGVQQALFLVKDVIDLNAKVSDLMVDVQRTAELTGSEIDALVNKLKSIDTRTSLQGLLEIAKVGGQMGIAKDQLAGFTKEVDKLSVVLKDEIPGGTDAIATAVGKIGSIYGTFQQYGVEDGLNRIGSLILRIGQVGLATGEYLQDFDLRVAGTATTLGLSLPRVTAYGAVLQETGVTAEVAGTAMSKLFTFLATRRDKFFAIAQLADAKLTIKEFTDLINTDASKALDLFFQGLNKGGKQVTTFFDLITEGMGQKGQRMTEAISKLAQNQSLFNQRLAEGSEEFANATAVEEQFRLKNENLASGIDKLHHALQNLVTDPDSRIGKFFSEATSELAKLINEVNGVKTDNGPLSDLIIGDIKNPKLNEDQLKQLALASNVDITDGISKWALENNIKAISDKRNSINDDLINLEKSLGLSGDLQQAIDYAKDHNDRELTDALLNSSQVQSFLSQMIDIYRKRFGETPETSVGSAESTYAQQLQKLLDSQLKTTGAALPLINPKGTKTTGDKTKSTSTKTLDQIISDSVQKISDAESNELNILEISKLQKTVTDKDYYEQKKAIITKYEDEILGVIKSYNKQDENIYSQHALKKQQAISDATSAELRLQLDAITKQHNAALLALNGENAPGGSSKEDIYQFQYEQDQKRLAIDQTMLNQLKALEKDHADHAKDQLSSITKAVQEDDQKILADREKLRQALNDASFQAVTDSYTPDKTQAALDEEQKRNDILNNATLSQIEKEKELKNLKRESDAKDYDIEAQQAKDQLAVNEVLHFAMLESDTEYTNNRVALLKKYNDAKEKADQKELQLELDKQHQKDQLEQLAVETVQKAADATISIWENQTKANHDAAEKQLDDDTQRKLKLATSQAEYDQINRDAQAKKDALDRKEQEQLREAAIVQAGIQFASASFAIWSKYGTDPFSIPIAIAETALLATQYGITIAELNKQKFEFGGEVPGNGGEFGGQPHSRGGTDFRFQGRAFNAEAGELAIINKRSSQDRRTYTLTGTPKQIASSLNELGGGVSFAKGARMLRFADGGLIGGDYRPPVITYGGISQMQNITTRELNSLKEMVFGLAAAVSTEAGKPVFVVQKDIDAAHAKRVRALNFGAL